MADRALECPVFKPSLEDVRGLTFEEYVESIEPVWGPIGVCRIVAPEGWSPRRSGYNDLDQLALPRPIRQHATGRQGLYRTLLVEQRSVNLGDFKAVAQDPANSPPQGEPEALERKFWKNVPMNPPLYGADVEGSLFDERTRGWNLRRLSSLLSRTLESAGASIPGVTQPYLYAGSWRSFFAWHTEDLDLHSVNYLHTGAPKTWYVVPPAARERFELLVRDLLPELSRCCPEFLRHKEILVSPALLAAHNIPFVRALHHAREFVVVGPGAYHAGFNHGFNLAESVNFATRAWVPVGARASFCTCRPDSVKIDMRLFLDYMDAELAEEVRDSYRSDSDSDCEHDHSEEESEEDEEDSSSEDGQAVAQSDSEEESSSGESSEEEEERQLPAKRVRKPTAKALACGLGTPLLLLEPSPPLRRGARQATASSKRAAAAEAAAVTAVMAPPRRPATTSRGKLLLQRRRQRERQEQQRGQAAQRAAAAVQRRQRTAGGRKRTRDDRAAENADGLLPSPASVAHIHASSDDDSAGVTGVGVGVASRAASQRGAAKAWYRMFDSLLPSLKRARC